MLDLNTRVAILRLHREGHGIRLIARTLWVSRRSVKKVIASGQADVPTLQREASLGPHIDRVRQLHAACKGNRIRVHEELTGDGIGVAYSHQPPHQRLFHG